ncbi:AAA family ATPase [Chengkuizengella axinellae]|uniref:AAA family ATPase n=1 Tax=Chengkuizengella axinellae TaxID=3064388 RepID=A0ABT9J4P6_9BACL|nr:AAA family ATPase [Chengkuizengella sp. 2205SS18-9]MDP5276564.1 AAA family ATPase [Chengkuizengella sp. 2205SS18-9]
MNILLCGDSMFVKEMMPKLQKNQFKIVGIGTSTAQSAHLLKAKGYDVVLIGFNEQDSLALLEDNKYLNNVTIVWVSLPIISIQSWKRFATIGVIAITRGSEIQAVKTYRSSGHTDKIIEMKQPADEEDSDCQVISVYSPKGGEGKTTISTYLAYYIAKYSKLKVCIIDLDHTREGSDVARKFGYFVITEDNPGNDITNWNSFPDKEFKSWKKVSEYMTQTSLHNLFFISSPWNIEDEKFMTESLIEKTTPILKHHFDFIIFDMADDLRESNTKALELSDDILFISGIDLDMIDISSSFVQRTTQKLQLPIAKIRLVFNKIPSKLPYKLDDISQKIGVPRFGVIPYDAEVHKPRIKKVGIREDLRKTPFGNSIFQLVQALLPDGRLQNSYLKKPWYKRIFNKKGVV